MRRLIGKFVLWLTGWHSKGGIDFAQFPKGVLIGAPHTSNWDFIFAMAGLYDMRVPVRFLAKKELFRFPLGLLLRAMGGVPVDRSKRSSMVEAMADTLAEAEKLVVLIPPEGTRSVVKEWKSGFYHVAQLAGAPIFPGYLDYKKKEAGIGQPFFTTGNYDLDLQKIKAFYQSVTPKNPELFKI